MAKKILTMNNAKGELETLKVGDIVQMPGMELVAYQGRIEGRLSFLERGISEGRDIIKELEVGISDLAIDEKNTHFFKGYKEKTYDVSSNEAYSSRDKFLTEVKL